ncbi:MAG: inorganic phosphate transporter [Endomicrobiales bacterium]|nr:inorganic phosphate transporter [Endomicrobiales bacterium]
MGIGLEIIIFAIVILVFFAIFDLIVGVSNDAVNFLNSAIGSKVAPFSVIMIVASLGIMAGVTFSSGMMEVARKGIFHPGFFTMPELIVIFLGVMITDVILLDMFNTYGLPTSTTVSIVFELLGAAVAISAIKIYNTHGSLTELAQYINTSKAMIIIFGILLSVAVAFVCGSAAQFVSRFVFTFNYEKRIKRYGAIWGGVALSLIVYFILVKGAKGTSFMTKETVEWIKANSFNIISVMFVASAVLLQILIFFKVNIFKPIVLIGTFALAMAFAANDLMNFIGVPMAGYHAYKAAILTDAPLLSTMGMLSKTVPTSTALLLLAGLIMVITLWISKKAKGVTETSINLGSQEEGVEMFESISLSRVIVKLFINVSNMVRFLVPVPVQNWIAGRFDASHYHANIDKDNRPSFDLLRASVNLVVASAIISYATSRKLPLSTTYITFMVAMGTSFADQAWGRESAVYRVSGVLTVIGGWFMTAFLAFTMSCIAATVMYYTEAPGIIFLVITACLIVWKHNHKFGERKKGADQEKVFNLRKVKDINTSISTTFEHIGILLQELRVSLDTTITALLEQNKYSLGIEKNKTKKFQRWANIIVANIFKSLRLLQREHSGVSYKYGQTIRALQKLADGHRDITMRSFHHVRNHYRGLLDAQKEELRGVANLLHDILLDSQKAFSREHSSRFESMAIKHRELKNMAEKLHRLQMDRISEDISRTRLSILYYAIIGNAIMISKENLKLLKIFNESFSNQEIDSEFELD